MEKQSEFTKAMMKAIESFIDQIDPSEWEFINQLDIDPQESIKVPNKKEKKMKSKPSKPLTAKAFGYILSNAGTMPVKSIAKVLKRKESTIRKVGSRLGVSLRLNTTL